MIVQTVYPEFPKTCLTLGVLSAIVTGLSLPVCIGVGIYVNLNVNAKPFWCNGEFKNFASWDEALTLSEINMALYIALFFNAIGFAMSLALIAGVKERNATMLKSYFNFGIFILVVIIVVTHTTMIVLADDFPWYGYILYLIILGSYLALLVMVYITYKSFAASALETDSSPKKTTKEDKTTNEDKITMEDQI